jgi:transcriptional regulator with XRE-family HTH domain
MGGWFGSVMAEGEIMVDNPAHREQIASRLRSARKAVGLSQAQVAKRLRVHRPTISEMEAGRRRVSADELAHLAEIYRAPVEWFTSGVHVEAEPEDERLTLAIQLLKGLNDEDLDRVVAWLCRIHEKDDGEDKAEVYTPTLLVERTAADAVQEGAPQVAYRRCLHYDMPVRDHQSREDLRCPALIPVKDGGEASYYCRQHQGDAPAEPATLEELEEVRADLETLPAGTPYLRLLTTMLDAQSMRASAGDGKKQQRTV